MSTKAMPLVDALGNDSVLYSGWHAGQRNSCRNILGNHFHKPVSDKLFIALKHAAVEET
jgi:hypothetical protein